MKVEKLKAMLRKMLAEFGEISTDKGVLVWNGDEDLKEGDAVHSVDEDGNDVKVEDGDYRTEDGKIIVVADGKVVEIKDDEAEVAPEGEITEEPKEGVEAEEKTEEIVEEPKEEPKEDEKDLKIKELEDVIKAKDEEIEILKARIAELEAEPTDKSAEEAFAEIKKVENPMAKRGYRW
jgi:hypothetical protein